MLHRVDHDVLENLYLTPQNGHFCPRHQFEKCPDFPIILNILRLGVVYLTCYSELHFGSAPIKHSSPRVKAGQISLKNVKNWKRYCM